jgi:hypothetical protein
MTMHEKSFTRDEDDGDIGKYVEKVHTHTLLQRNIHEREESLTVSSSGREQDVMCG